MMTKFIASLFIMFGFLGLANADGLNSLDNFLQNVQSGSAQFQQTVRQPQQGGQEGGVAHSSGEFSFQRPGSFRFDYNKPFAQQIVGDGKTLWIYDEELNQVSSRAQKEALNSTPIAILAASDSRAQLAQDFDLVNIQGGEGLEWIEVTPHDKEGQLRKALIGFRGEQLVALDIEDNFGQISNLRFSTFKFNQKLDVQRFVFTPPPDSDVIENSN